MTKTCWITDRISNKKFQLFVSLKIIRFNEKWEKDWKCFRLLLGKLNLLGKMTDLSASSCLYLFVGKLNLNSISCKKLARFLQDFTFKRCLKKVNFVQFCWSRILISVISFGFWLFSATNYTQISFPEFKTCKILARFWIRAKFFLIELSFFNLFNKQ